MYTIIIQIWSDVQDDNVSNDYTLSISFQNKRTDKPLPPDPNSEEGIKLAEEKQRKKEEEETKKEEEELEKVCYKLSNFFLERLWRFRALIRRCKVFSTALWPFWWFNST